MTDKTPWYRRFFENKDRNAITICFSIALLFWLTKALSEDYVHDYAFRLDYQLNENLSFTAPARSVVEARLSGQGWELFKASLKRRFKTVPVPVHSDVITRTDIVTAIYTHLGDFEIAVRDVDADVINLETDMVINKMVPVIMKGYINPAEGYMLSDQPDLDPAQIEISGPAAIVGDIRSIETEVIEVVDLEGSFSAESNLVVPNADYLNVTPASVTVSATANQEISVIRSVRVVIKGDTAGFVMKPSTIQAEFRIPESSVLRLDSVDVAAELIIPANKDSIFTVNPTLNSSIPFPCESVLTTTEVSFTARGNE